MKEMLQDLMREATRLTQTGRLKEATDAIRRALGKAPATPQAPSHPAGEGASASHGTTGTAGPGVLDGCVFEVDAPPPAATAATPTPAPATASPSNEPQPRAPDVRETAPEALRAAPGEFTDGRHTHAALTRRYKLYTPRGAVDGPLPLVVMLHGCTQDPDDFAAGTLMNERAREQGFFVLYPAQSQQANPSRCWNWFKHNHQERGRGEPALIASMTLAVMKQHDIDPRRVFIAGLSAGGAMAAIVAAAYPEVFAAIGVHSGLPLGAARNLPEALAAMKGGAGPGLMAPMRSGKGAAPTPVQKSAPIIVFHGDQDQTVHPRNGEQLIEAALGSAEGVNGHADPLRNRSPQLERGATEHGRHYTRATHAGTHSTSVAEHWVVHGSGHAWSGGGAGGSYTDPQGPDATREMLRFFFEHPLIATA